MPSTILLLNGPNLNLLGQREPEIYGHETLADVEALARDTARDARLELVTEQSNHEGALIDLIQNARGTHAGIIVNPGGLTHTSVALRDALAAFDGPVIELHISNIHRREPFRHHSYVSGVADAVIAGCGVHGYRLAVLEMARRLDAGA